MAVAQFCRWKHVKWEAILWSWAVSGPEKQIKVVSWTGVVLDGLT